jgi:hypothetical protein
MNPRVIDVKAIDDFKLLLRFTSGESGIYDCTPLLDFGVFKELQDIYYFKQAKVLDGSVAWPHEQDICPDTLYLDSKKIKKNRLNRGTQVTKTPSINCKYNSISSNMNKRSVIKNEPISKVVRIHKSGLRIKPNLSSN